MKPEQWQRVKVLFEDALQYEQDRRLQFLEQICEDDLEVRAEVGSLLDAHEQAGGFMDAPAFEDIAHLLLENAVGPDGERRIGPYRLLSLLGVGGMGEVYLAVDARLGREVALKLLPAEFAEDGARVKRFEREARIASALNHPNILTIYETGRDGDALYIATEYVKGQTLRRRLAAGAVDVMEAVNVAIQICAALEAAHGAGVLHRDIKPENIMLRSDGIVKALDFGLAKQIEGPIDLTGNAMPPMGASYESAPGLLIGTIRYMSPEQVRGQKLDARSDLWSLGAALYEMTAGVAPFDGETPSDVIAAILAYEPPEPAKPCPPELQRIIKRALAKDRLQRYASAGELALDLNNLERGLRRRSEAETQVSTLESTPTTPVRTTGSERVSGNRRRRAISAAVAALLFLPVLSAFLIRSIRQSPFASPLPASPERRIDYSLIVQKTRSGEPIGETFEASGQESFESGWQFRLRLVSPQSGHLYLLNEGPASQGTVNYRALFPAPSLNQGSSVLIANESMLTGWYVFDDRPGVEKLWIIWAATAVEVLEAARNNLNAINQGLIGDLAQRQAIREWLARRAADQTVIESDDITRRSLIRGRSEPLVGLIELKHR